MAASQRKQQEKQVSTQKKIKKCNGKEKNRQRYILMDLDSDEKIILYDSKENLLNELSAIADNLETDDEFEQYVKEDKAIRVFVGKEVEVNLIKKKIIPRVISLKE